MNIFLSWSGPSSRAIAAALRDWLPVMFGGIAPFMSSVDIGKGLPWAEELDAALERTHFGIICLTPENTSAPWILYEAGAIAKSVGQARCACLLHGIRPANLEFPLARFQATLLERDDVLLLIRAINELLGDSGQAEAHLAVRFEALWPSLSKAVDAAIEASPHQDTPVARDARELLEELLVETRARSRGGPVPNDRLNLGESPVVPYIPPRWAKEREIEG